MGFLTRNDDVFLLDSASVTGGNDVTITEKRSPDDNPMLVEVKYYPAANSRVAVDFQWNTISAVRRHRGDNIDFSFVVDRTGEIGTGDLLVLRFPVRSDRIWDEVFATVAAVAMRIGRPGCLIGLELGFGSQSGLEFALPMTLREVVHIATAWKYAAKPVNPYIELRLHFSDVQGPLAFRLGRLFAGQDYDPYVYNPAYEYSAFINGRPEFHDAGAIKTEFVSQARDISRKHRFVGMQAFVRPFLVMREGDPQFPMLIGTPNSISWYAIDPPHGIETYHRDSIVRPGDISLDCGAHAGQMAALFALVGGPSGKVFAFDPFPQNYYQVEAQGRLNQLPGFVSTRTGVGLKKESISVSINGQSTSLEGQEKQSDRMMINIEPLDDYVDAKPTFVKLDIEGAEVAALQGAQQLMRTCKPRIFIEVHTQMLGDFGHNLTDLFAAIPGDVYHVRYKIEGAHSGWLDFRPGIEAGVSAPLLVFATPR